MLKTIAKFKTTLAAAISASATSLTLTSVNSEDNTAIPNGIYGFVIDEGNQNEEYVIGSLSGTTVSTLSRGISYEDGSTEITANKKSHRKGATIKITDHPAIIQIIKILNGDTTITNAIKSSATPSNDDDLVNKAYSDAQTVAGGADASTSIKGISKLSTAPVNAANPIAVGDNDPRIPTTDEKAAMAGTSTPSTSNKFVCADDAVLDTGNQTIAGTKTFSSIPILPASDPTADNEAARKYYVDSKMSSITLFVASDNLKASADTERSQTGSTPTIKKEIKVRRAGTIRVTGEIKHGTGVDYAKCAIYINGIAVTGAEASTNQTSYQSFSLDIAVKAEDMVQLYLYVQSGTGTAYCRYFRLKWDETIATATYVVNTD
ncbi:MAG: hypothetical protein CSYNP_03128 [Syntrophus sp. SKADARSKE-3]|nr:hypothetical protein [Syntrophus sp. SKADARSKE-3]